MENSSGANLLGAGSTFVQGIISKNNFEVNETGLLPAGADITVQEPGIFNLFGGAANSTVFATKGAACLGCLTSTFVTSNDTDTALHVKDNLNGGSRNRIHVVAGRGQWRHHTRRLSKFRRVPHV